MTKYLIFVLSAMTACSSLPSIDYLDYAKSSFNYVSGRNDFKITQEYFDSQEYSFLKLKIGRSSSIMMVLAYVNDGIYEWVSADNKKLYTYRGKVIESSGFKNDFKIQYPQSKIKNFLSTLEMNYAVDFFQPQLLNLNINTMISQNNKSSSYIRLNNHELFQGYKEIISAPLIGWKAKNYYYYDSEGKIFKTIQNIHPRIPALDIEYYIKL
ncbi:YjbF family lipoprotein [Gammaproteobacteria bacterium]|nr:YjbF family lipoprotein [Gammaproteobacteria bacterium]